MDDVSCSVVIWHGFHFAGGEFIFSLIRIKYRHDMTSVQKCRVLLRWAVFMETKEKAR